MYGISARWENGEKSTMVSRLNFSSRFDIEKTIIRYPGIFAVDSNIEKGLTYCISDGKFAVLRVDGALFCPLHETPQLAGMLKPEFGNEIMEIYKEYVQ